jgi:hypothetical protein
MDNASNFLKSEFQYQMLNINLLNKAFIKRNYPLLETTLIDETLSCGCNKELGELNLISGKSKSWIIEQNSDSVFLYDFINSSEGKSIPVRIQKKLLKAYKW